ncbi:MAG TPA: FAD-dependent monooxygenase [Planctomycetota bacterium]|nr:FAD-dependent monooxygenase [Planctomycetota bacterium]
MKIVCIGGGPAGLYFAILARQAFPECEVTVHERNRPGDTFGWGVVFSDETLGNFEAADPASYAAITAAFVRWTDIETWRGREVVRSTGHGFSGMSRRRLLEIFHARARELGVELVFESEVGVDDVAAGADLVVACDGIHSAVREARADAFRPSIDWRPNRFTWLGTTRPMDAFTFVFAEDEHGSYVAHAYPFERSPDGAWLGTWIVETHEDTWRRAGLDRASEAETVAHCERVFAAHLAGHPLLPNKSIWRAFPTVVCERWHADNVVLLGDAAHSAHFSIGSGTKLAMEDAIALCDAFRRHGTRDVPRVLAAYQEARYVETRKLQRAAQTSLEWFEDCRRFLDQPLVQLTFNLMTRSKRITYDNLRLRDPALVERAAAWWAEEQGAGAEPDGRAPAPLFAPLQLRRLRLANRIVVSPMCQYSAVDGCPDDWHLVHLGSRAVGGAGLVFTEMTDVTPEGRITHGCTGLWDDAQERAWRRIVEFVHRHSAAAIGIQLAHAGRKASCHLPWEGGKPLTGDAAWKAIGPSATPFAPGGPTPRAMTRADMDRVRDAFAAATVRALRCGFDVVELHMAHGYLLSTFLSPASNRRTDEYGGSLANRARYPLEVLEAVRAQWPEDRPLFVRLSATDWLEHEPGAGITLAESVELARWLAERGCDVVDVSSAGNTPDSEVVYGRMYQVPFAERIRHEAGVRTMAVGAIQGADHANTVLLAGRADLCALARPHLLDPYLTLRAAVDHGHAAFPWPDQYLPAKPQHLRDGKAPLDK